MYGLLIYVSINKPLYSKNTRELHVRDLMVVRFNIHMQSVTINTKGASLIPTSNNLV